MSVFEVAALSVLLLVFSYVLTRAISFAYFRTKFEHFRAVMRELRKEDHG